MTISPSILTMSSPQSEAISTESPQSQPRFLAEGQVPAFGLAGLTRWT